MPIGPANGYIFGMGSLKFSVFACFHQTTATQRKAAIADIMAIIELRPTRTDIIIIEKFHAPAPGIKHMTIPLRDKAMRGFDMIDHLRQYEIRIGCR